MALSRRINCYHFVGQWKGHPIEDLETFRHIALEQRPNKPIVYLAGDSSLDNKYWVPGSGLAGEPLGIEVPQIYRLTLDRPTPKPDVAFWLNHMLGKSATCINGAIEESMLRQRDDELLPQDQFIHDNIRKEDVLIVSVGANDIALRPTFSTIVRMLALAWLTLKSSIMNGTAWSLPYFARLFGTKTEAYINRLCSKTMPRAIILCMIYYPLEAQHGQRGWADLPLRLLGYNRSPGKLQAAIRKMFDMGTANVRVEGTEVVPCKLYEVLDGTRKEDYVARVEPSSQGGRKMAEKFKDLVGVVLKKEL
ncbi:hypothetical protein N0V90_003558 [Kalmusia sp. IMI 367209]|nr:hypothetical protein N0V90_003558 [Kalmusia sp. IMI 367209]